MGNIQQGLQARAYVQVGQWMRNHSRSTSSGNSMGILMALPTRGRDLLLAIREVTSFTLPQALQTHIPEQTPVRGRGGAKSAALSCVLQCKLSIVGRARALWQRGSQS